MTGQEETAASCNREGLDRMLGKMSSLKGFSGIGTSCLGKCWNHHPWKLSEGMQMEQFGVRFSGEHSGSMLMSESVTCRSFPTIMSL